MMIMKTEIKNEEEKETLLASTAFYDILWLSTTITALMGVRKKTNNVKKYGFLWAPNTAHNTPMKWKEKKTRGGNKMTFNTQLRL